VVVLPCVALAVAWWAGDAGARLRVVLLAGAAGLLAYGWMLVEGWRGERTWAVDFFDTANPFYRAWRLVLPDYRQPTTATWWLHAAWVALVVALAVLGWRRSARAERRDSTSSSF
jgi:hypothetical protein